MTPSPRARQVVSVVIPVKDDAALLDRCLRALAAQTRAPDEIVVVDNGSSDHSARVATRHHVRLIAEPRPGILAAAACGYDEAVGELILRLDADTVPPADWIERMSAALEHDPGVAAVTGPGVFLGLAQPLNAMAGALYMGLYFTVLARVLRLCPLLGSNMAMRRDAWHAVSADVHRDDPAVHDDLDLAIRLAVHGCRVEVDRRTRVGISAAPLMHPFGMAGRLTRAIHTVARSGGLRAVRRRRI